MLRLLLVRHGETRWNAERRIQGAGSDVDLSDTGRLQAQRLAQVFKGENVAGIYSSPLRRARATAEAVAGLHNIEPRMESRLKEIDAGELEGILVDSLGYNLSQFLVPEPGGSMPDLPGGEGLDDLQERTWSVVEGILEAHKDPSQYPDLIVRVTGFSAYFANLSEELRQVVVDRIVSGE